MFPPAAGEILLPFSKMIFERAVFGSVVADVLLESWSLLKVGCTALAEVFVRGGSADCAVWTRCEWDRAERESPPFCLLVSVTLLSHSGPPSKQCSENPIVGVRGFAA